MKLNNLFLVGIIAMLFLLVSAGACTASESREEWPMFGQNSQRTGFADTDGAETGNPIWAFEAEDVITSSPVVFDGKVYVLSHAGSLHALDAGSGEEVWANSVGEWGGFSLPLKGMGESLLSSPAVGEDLVFVGSWDEKVYAFDADNGEKVWSFDTSEVGGVGGRVDSSPTVKNGTVYVGARDNNMYALDAETGDMEWYFETEDIVTSSPAVLHDSVYFGSRDEKLYSLDIRDGELNWSYQTGDIVHSSPAVVEFVDNGGKSGFSSRVKTFYEFFGKLGGVYVFQIGIFLGAILLGYLFLSLSNPLSFEGFSVLFLLALFVFLIFAPATFQDVQESEVVYGGSRSGSFYALDADNGSSIWDFENVNPGKGRVFVNTSPAVGYGNAYFGASNGKIYALDSKSGNLEWKFQTDYRVGYSSPAIADGTLYEGSFDGRYYALDTASGEEIWSFKVLGYARQNGYAISSPSVSGGKVFVTSSPFDGGGSKVYALGSSADVEIKDLNVEENSKVNENVGITMDVKNTKNQRDNYVIRLLVEPTSHEAPLRVETKQVELGPDDEKTSKLSLMFDRGGEYVISSPDYSDNEEFEIIDNGEIEIPEGYDKVYETSMIPIFYTNEISENFLVRGADNVANFFTEVLNVGHLAVRVVESAYVEMSDNVLDISVEISFGQEKMVQIYAQAFYQSLEPLGEGIYEDNFVIKLVDGDGEIFREFAS